jgi:hypothetical protein
MKATTHRSKTGQAFIVFAAALLVLAAACVFAADVGLIYFSRARLQNAADAAVLAATQELVEERNEGATEEYARALALEEAQGIVNANWDEAGWEVAFGRYVNGNFVAEGHETKADSVRVIAKRDESSPGGALNLFFAPVLNLASVEVTARGSSAIFGGIGTIRGNLFPFAVHENDVAPAGQSMVLYPGSVKAPGNFGLLNLDGGNLGTSELQAWIINGYPGEVTIDPETGSVVINGDTGWRSALQASLEQRMGDIVFVCVYDQVTEKGANAEFRIRRFLAIKLQEIVYHEAEDDDAEPGIDHINVEVQYVASVPNGETDDSIDDNLVKISLVL